MFTPSIISFFILACSNDDSKVDTQVKQDTSVPKLDAQGEWAQKYSEEIQTLVDATDDFASINHLEMWVSRAETQLISPWIASWKNGEAQKYQNLIASLNSGLDWKQAQSTVNRTSNGIVEKTLTIPLGNDSAFDYIENFEKIHDFDLKIVHVQEQDDELIFTLEFDLRAELPSGLRIQDRGHVVITTNKEENLQIISMTASSLERIEAQRQPAYVDMTEQWGLRDTLPITDRKEAIRRGGYALVVADYDQDGHVDMLVGNYGPINLLRNTGNGFEDVTASAGLDPEEVIKGAGFVDMDNDGDRDIVMLRFTDSTDSRGDFVIYENNGNGTFTKHTDVLPRRRSYDTPMPLSLGDYNNDGWIDIYIGFPGIRDFTSGISQQERPDWQASQGIWFNQGNWTFVEADDDNAVIADNDTYAHAAASTDLDGDGWIDLLVVDDSGRINPVFRNSGTGNFESLGDEAGLSYTGLSMGVSTGDFNNDGLLDIMSSHVAMNAGSRIGYSIEGIVADDSQTGQIMKRLRNDYVDIQLFMNNGDGTFQDVSSTSNLQWAGEAAGAGEWLDYNHDGLLDYYLPNGLWSGGSTSLDSLFLRAELILYGISILGGEEGEIALDLTNDIHGGPIFSKTQIDENTEDGGYNPILTLLRNHREHGEAPLTYSLAGYQRNALFRNNGDGTFTEVGFLEGVDRIEDGYIVAPVDVDGDGLQDLVLRNTDPAPEQNFQPVIALQNQLEGSHTLTVRLLSEQGNTDGLGARVTAYVGDTMISREIRSVSGAVQAEPTAYFGLGQATKVDRIVVTWLGGATQEIHDIDAGTITITQQ